MTPPTLSAKTRPIPFDYQATQLLPDWRETLRWPSAFSDSFAIGQTAFQNYFEFLNNLDEDTRQLALQAGIMSLIYARFVTDLALCLQHSHASSIKFIGLPAEAAILGGDEIVAVKDDPFHSGLKALRVLPRMRHSWLRRLARTASMNSAFRLPTALVKPNIIAISHNPLLMHAAKVGDLAVGFCHAETIMAQALSKSSYSVSVPQGLAETMTSALTALDTLEHQMCDRTTSIVLPFVENELRIAARELGALREFRHLPHHIWSGTGGKLSARAIGIEVMRRGGDVTRFDHGYCTPLVEVVEPTVSGELVVSTQFAMSTNAAAVKLKALSPGRFIPFASPQIISVGSDESLKKLPLISQGNRSRRRVVYAPTVLPGTIHYHPPILPDPVYLDWQLRVAEALSKMPIDLICQPHPEGIVAGHSHPLASIATTHEGRFEDLMAEADVFVFDYGQSTTVSEALCTDRNVVLFDLGNPLFSVDAQQMIERRCRVIRARFDDRNLPRFDADELREAVCGGAERADPSEFHALLM